MVKRHMKRQSAPKSWNIERKGTKFIIRPAPGKDFRLSVPLSMVFKEYLGYAKTTKEVNNILQDKEIFIDGTRRKDKRYLVGLMDTVSIPVSKESYRMMLNKKGKLHLVSIDKKESDIKVCRISNKSTINNDIVQINFSEGRNIRINKKDDKYKVGDSLLMTLPKQEITDHFKFEKGAYALLIGGKHTGENGTIEKIDNNNVEIKADGNSIVTKKKYAFVVGKDKPEITIVAK